MNKTFKVVTSDKITKYYLSNKFFYKKTKELPYLKKLSVNFNQKNSEIKQIAMSSLALNVLFIKRGNILLTKTPNLLLKIKKGSPTGSELSFNNKILVLEALKIIFDILHYNECNVSIDTKNYNSMTFNIPEIFNYKKLENFFFVFFKLKTLNISIVSDSSSNYKTNEEIKFLINYFFSEENERIKHL